MTDREREHREASNVPGFGRVGGIDDPVPRAEYGDDREAVREHAEREAAARDFREGIEKTDEHCPDCGGTVVRVRPTDPTNPHDSPALMCDSCLGITTVEEMNR